jgi:RimJ/RimL family protein N-acetyltransferase
MFRVWGDPEVMRFIPRGVYASVDEVRAAIERLLGPKHSGAMSAWALERTSDRRVIGMAALVPVAWKGPEVEVAYHLARDVWGLGYATEAARACIDYGLGELGLSRVVALTEEENTASQRVLEKAGMKRLGPTERYYEKRLLEFEVVRAP